MKPNKMQQEVIDSKKRITVITAQPGSGSTTALILKLAEECSKSSNNLGILIRRTPTQVKYFKESFLRRYPGSRISKESGIITFKYNSKTVKIKIASVDDLDLYNHIPLVAVDCGCQVEILPDIINCAGKIIVSDFMCSLEEKDSWAYKSGILEDIDKKPTWKPYVKHVVGFTRDNPGLDEEYLTCLDNLRQEVYSRMMQVRFSSPS